MDAETPQPDFRNYPTHALDNITGEVGEENPVNTVYRMPSGRHVKIKTYEARHVSSLENQRHFIMRAVFCDEAGQRLDDGRDPKLHLHTSNLHPSMGTHAEQAEDGRRVLALMHELIEFHQNEVVPGSLPAPDDVLALLGGQGWRAHDPLGMPEGGEPYVPVTPPSPDSDAVD